MTTTKGTLENIAIELKHILQPLEKELQPGKAHLFFAELGIFITPVQEVAIIAPLQDSAGKAGLLVTKTTELVEAVAAGQTATIIQKSAELVSRAKNVIDSFAGIQNAVATLNLPGVDAAKIPGRLFNELAARYVKQLIGLTEVLVLMGILEQTDQNADSTDPSKPPFTLSNFHFDKIANWLSNPSAELKNLYKWNDPSFDGRLLLLKLKEISIRQGLPLIYDDTVPSLDFVAVKLTTSSTNPKGIEVLLQNAISGDDITLSGDDFDFLIKSAFAIPSGSKFVIQPAGVSLIPPAGAAQINGELFLEHIVKDKKTQQPMVLFGQVGGSRLELMEFHVKTGTKLTWDASQQKANGDFVIEGAIKKGKISINAAGADGFLKNILPSGNLEATFDLDLGVSATHGFYFGGSSGLEIQLPLHADAGPVSLEGLTIALQSQNGNFPLTIGVDIRATLGPIVAAVQNIGVSANFSFLQNNSGNLGPVQMNIGFKPPSGVGLSIDAGLVKGGGFLILDSDKGEYAGGLELTISGTLQVAAIGIINTKMPDGSAGFSLLVIVSVQFNPGIALGMGFFLNGLGGMLGINRTINVNALRDGVKNNAIEHIMFPQNIVANMNTLIPQIKTIFPVKKDQFMIGLMAKITWGVPTLVTVEFGLAIEFANPTRLAILGVLKVVLPTEKAALLQLQVNFVGIIDFNNGYLSFDASLFNSRILTFTLEGDMALRLNWGANKGFIMSIGGFHPAFNPPAQLNVPKLKRLTLTILSGNPKLVLTAYFAVTSNTVQFGARIDFRFNVAFVSLVGFLGFDVLFQFSPFKFIAHIFAGLAVKWNDTVLFAIQLDFQLSGPTPWNARGLASFSILFITIKVSFNITWGKAAELVDPSIAVLPKVLEAFALEANWSASLPVDKSSLVTLASIKAASGEVIIQSHAAISINQTILPLDTRIDKFGNNTPADIKSVKVESFKIGGKEASFKYLKDSFVPAAYKKLSDDDKLKSPSYTQEKSGIKATDNDDAINIVYGINRDVLYETRVCDVDVVSGDALALLMELFQQLMAGGITGSSPLSVENKNKNFVQGGAVAMGEEAFVIINNKTLLPHAGDVFNGGSQAEANDAYQSFINVNPQLKNLISVVPAYHLDF